MKYLLALLLVVTSLSVFAIERGPALSASYTPEKITDGIYVIHGPIDTPNPVNQGFMNNPGIIETSVGIVVVDPGGTVQSGEMVLQKVAAMSDKPIVAVFDTHIHGDHWLGNQAIKAKYPDVKIYAHPQVFTEIESGEGQAWVNMMEQLTEGASKGTEIVGPDAVVNHGDVITIGDVEMHILHFGVAHTDTDIMIYLPARKTIFLGDNALIGRIGRIDHSGNVKGNIETLKKALETDSEHFIPGHGPTNGRAVAQKYHDFLSILYAEVGKYYEEGLADFEMKPQIVEQLANWSEWVSFDEQVGKIINTSFHEIEEASF